MKKLATYLLISICTLEMVHSQTENVVALDLPVRNSLTFNRFVLNPTFSFVREQNKYISITNKRELIKVEDAPQSFLVNYSGRFKENIGAGLGVFQQNYGVFTVFGGVVNFAYNIQAQKESNFTFGLNLGAYKSGLNNGNIVNNFPDPALDNIPENFLLTINPGLNYGTGFFDFGVSLRNVVTYNSTSAKLLSENPKKGIQGHVMYEGYFGGYGFFGDSRFSALARTEFQSDDVILSSVLMLTVPKGIWAQVGYNSVYGASGGLGVNLTEQIAIEYNFEKPFMGLSNFGPSHEITLAYRFKNNNYYDYSRDDELAGLLDFEKPRKKKIKKNKPIVSTNVPVTQEPINNIETKKTAILSKIASEEQDKLGDTDSRTSDEQEKRLVNKEQSRVNVEKQTQKISEENTKEAAQEAERIVQLQNEKRVAEKELELRAKQARVAAIEAAALELEKQVKKEVQENEIAKNEINTTEGEKMIVEDELGKAISVLTKETEASEKEQEMLLGQLQRAVSIKAQDLKDLKEENDLSEQDVFVLQKPFKSISEENKKIELLKIDLDTVIIRQRRKINQLESLLKNRSTTLNDTTNIYFNRALEGIKEQQVSAIRTRASLVSSLKEINIATDIERKRRIKRAAYDNDQDRYLQDRNVLKDLKNNVKLNNTPLKVDDLDFGEKQSDNIQILKNVENTERAYYLVYAIHSNKNNRDEFLRKILASGRKKVDFFFDVITSKYYIYSDKYSSIEEANSAKKNNNDPVINKNISIIKIEN